MGHSKKMDLSGKFKDQNLPELPPGTYTLKIKTVRFFEDSGAIMVFFDHSDEYKDVGMYLNLGSDNPAALSGVKASIRSIIENAADDEHEASALKEMCATVGVFETLEALVGRKVTATTITYTVKSGPNAGQSRSTIGRIGDQKKVTPRDTKSSLEKPAVKTNAIPPKKTASYEDYDETNIPF